MAVKEIQPAEVRARRARGESVFLLDVREPDEVAAWAYPNAVTIPMGEIATRIDELPTDQQIVVACHLGGRSERVAEYLIANGFDAINLTGGAVAWAASEDDLS